MGSNERNYRAVVMGVICIGIFIFITSATYKLYLIRKNGKMVTAIVENLECRKTMCSINVKIDGRILTAGSVSYDNPPHIGDSVNVYYLPSEDEVVQASVELSIYPLYFSLEFLLLLIAIYLIIAGLIGKKEVKREPFVKTRKRDRRKISPDHRSVQNQ